MPRTAFTSPVFSLGRSVRPIFEHTLCHGLGPSLSATCRAGDGRPEGLQRHFLRGGFQPLSATALTEGGKKPSAERLRGEITLPAGVARLAHASRERGVLEEPEERLQ